jgi:small subunit ribosomal protein S2
MVTIPTTNELSQAAVNIGHRLNKRHPKMAKYIQGAKNGINMIDLKKTAEKLKEALDYVEQLGAQNATMIFVATKPAAKGLVKKYAEDINMPYINQRWLGGTLTNFVTISKLIEKLKKLAEGKVKDEWLKYTKKERLNMEKQLDRLEFMVGGLKSLVKLPDAVYVVDILQEATAIDEARKKKVPIVAITDTNTNPEKVTYAIPANDDASKSVNIITGLIVEAYKQGQSKAKKEVKKD